MASMHPLLRNMRANALNTFIGPYAFLRLFSSGYADLLVELLCDTTAFAAEAVDGVLTANPIADAVGLVAGNAALARIILSDGETIALGGLLVTGAAGAGPIRLSKTSTAISIGQVVSVASFVIIEGNL